MALKQQALSGFKRMPDDWAATAVPTVVQAMTGNLNFPAPVPTLEVVQTAFDDYATKLAIATKRGSPEYTALKNESKAALALKNKDRGKYMVLLLGIVSSLVREVQPIITGSRPI